MKTIILKNVHLNEQNDHNEQNEKFTILKSQLTDSKGTIDKIIIERCTIDLVFLDQMFRLLSKLNNITFSSVRFVKEARSTYCVSPTLNALSLINCNSHYKTIFSSLKFVEKIESLKLQEIEPYRNFSDGDMRFLEQQSTLKDFSINTVTVFTKRKIKIAKLNSLMFCSLECDNENGGESYFCNFFSFIRGQTGLKRVIFEFSYEEVESEEESFLTDEKFFKECMKSFKHIVNLETLTELDLNLIHPEHFLAFCLQDDNFTNKSVEKLSIRFSEQDPVVNESRLTNSLMYYIYTLFPKLKKLEINYKHAHSKPSLTLKEIFVSRFENLIELTLTNVHSKDLPVVPVTIKGLIIKKIIYNPDDWKTFIESNLNVRAISINITFDYAVPIRLEELKVFLLETLRMKFLQKIVIVQNSSLELTAGMMSEILNLLKTRNVEFNIFGNSFA